MDEKEKEKLLKEIAYVIDDMQKRGLTTYEISCVLYQDIILEECEKVREHWVKLLYLRPASRKRAH